MKHVLGVIHLWTHSYKKIGLFSICLLASTWAWYPSLWTSTCR